LQVSKSKIFATFICASDGERLAGKGNANVNVLRYGVPVIGKMKGELYTPILGLRSFSSQVFLLFIKILIVMVNVFLDIELQCSLWCVGNYLFELQTFLGDGQLNGGVRNAQFRHGAGGTDHMMHDFIAFEEAE